MLKGCGTNTCGFCGPRLADDWARAITAARPTLAADLGVPALFTWHTARKAVNALMKRLRTQVPEIECAWWSERVSVTGRVIKLVARDEDRLDLTAFDKSAKSVGFGPVLPSPKPEPEGDAELWLAELRSGTLRGLRSLIDAPTFTLATNEMTSYTEWNRERDARWAKLAHHSRGYFHDSSGNTDPQSRALAAASAHRNGPGGEVEAWALHTVPYEKEPGEFDIIWHDELWWETWRLRPGHVRQLVPVGLDPFDPASDPVALRELEERRWDAEHPTSDDPGYSEEEASDSAAVPWFDMEFRRTSGEENTGSAR